MSDELRRRFRCDRSGEPLEQFVHAPQLELAADHPQKVQYVADPCAAGNRLSKPRLRGVALNEIERGLEPAVL